MLRFPLLALSGHHTEVEHVCSLAPPSDAFLAALAVGDVRRSDIRAWNPAAHEIVPDPATKDTYAYRYRTFRLLYPRTQEHMR